MLRGDISPSPFPPSAPRILAARVCSPDESIQGSVLGNLTHSGNDLEGRKARLPREVPLLTSLICGLGTSRRCLQFGWRAKNL